LPPAHRRHELDPALEEYCPPGQLVQFAPPLEYDPAPHAVHAVRPADTATVPGRHDVHALCPDKALANETPHNVQFTLFGPGAKLPGGQAEQLPAPGKADLKPGAHDEHRALPTPFANLPARHIPQDDWPVSLTYRPIGQDVQVVALVLAAIVPTAQLVHTELPRLEANLPTAQASQSG
jgi:hypothetical protein